MLIKIPFKPKQKSPDFSEDLFYIHLKNQNHHNLLCANVCPEPIFKYFSNSKALSLFIKQI